MPDAPRIPLIRRMRAAGATWAQVGAALGIHATSAAGYARLRCPDACGPKIRRPRRDVEPAGPSEKLIRIQVMRRHGWSWPRIGVALGISASAARNYGVKYDPSLRMRAERR